MTLNLNGRVIMRVQYLDKKFYVELHPKGIRRLPVIFGKGSRCQRGARILRNSGYIRPSHEVRATLISIIVTA